MESYQYIKLEYELPSRNFTTKMCKDYFSWYMGVKEQRINCLLDYLNLSTDYTDETLDEVCQFCIENITTRRRSEQEIKELKGDFPISKKVQDLTFDISDESKLFLIDVGMYWGEVINQRFEKVNWLSKNKGTKNNVNYGHTVLGIEGVKTAFCPNRQASVFGFNVLSNDAKKDYFSDLINVWAKMDEWA